MRFLHNLTIKMRKVEKTTDEFRCHARYSDENRYCIIVYYERVIISGTEAGKAI